MSKSSTQKFANFLGTGKEINKGQKNFATPKGHFKSSSNGDVFFMAKTARTQNTVRYTKNYFLVSFCATRRIHYVASRRSILNGLLFCHVMNFDLCKSGCLGKSGVLSQSILD